MTASVVEYLLHSLDATWNDDGWARMPHDGNRYEVIDGVLYMTTARTFSHQQVVIGLVEGLGWKSEASAAAISVLGPVGVIMSDKLVVQPDFLLIRRERVGIVAQDDYIRGTPDLIVEVMSPDTHVYDTKTKRSAYARAGVPEFWILRPTLRDVLVYSRPDQALAGYADSRQFVAGTELESATLPIRVMVAELLGGVRG